ncbi:hypothetical protein, partial [Escherichia coli]|uniref:hypothetical protein n=1 Tax=Escherichia coli TaxID=562 RepID=UPI001F4A1857
YNIYPHWFTSLFHIIIFHKNTENRIEDRYACRPGGPWRDMGLYMNASRLHSFHCSGIDGRLQPLYPALLQP